MLPKAPHQRAFVPERVDLSGNLPTPGKQGTGSCVAWAVGYARSYYTQTNEKRPNRRPENISSPAYIYHALHEPAECGGGTLIKSALSLLQTGALSVAQYPFQDRQCRKLSSVEIEDATKFRIASWTTIALADSSSIEDIRVFLAGGDPVVTGLATYHLRGGSRWSYDERYQGPGGSGQGHAVTLVGFDDRSQRFKFINSWGTRWGENGFGFIDYDSFRKAADEAYVMRPIPDAAPAPPPHDPPSPAPSPAPPPGPLPAPPDDPTVGLKCGEVRHVVQDSGVVLSGYVATEHDLAAIKDFAAGQSLGTSLTLAPWPQCEALATLRPALVAADRPRIELARGKFSEGDLVEFEVRAPAQLRYLYVVYFQADGSVVELAQPAAMTPSPAQPGSALRFGATGPENHRFRVAKPFGREMILALASRSPLFDGPLPRGETDREFLTSLRKALIYKPDPALPDREVAADVATLTTEEK